MLRNLALLGALAFALAAISPAVAGSYSAATVGTSESTILTTRTGGSALDIVNNSATATVCINFDATATISGTVCAAGEITIPPLWHRSWDVPFVPRGDIHAVSSAASTPISLGSN